MTQLTWSVSKITDTESLSKTLNWMCVEERMEDTQTEKQAGRNEEK